MRKLLEGKSLAILSYIAADACTRGYQTTIIPIRIGSRRVLEEEYLNDLRCCLLYTNPTTMVEKRSGGDTYIKICHNRDTDNMYIRVYILSTCTHHNIYHVTYGVHPILFLSRHIQCDLVSAAVVIVISAMFL